MIFLWTIFHYSWVSRLWKLYICGVIWMSICCSYQHVVSLSCCYNVVLQLCRFTIPCRFNVALQHHVFMMSFTFTKSCCFNVGMMFVWCPHDVDMMHIFKYCSCLVYGFARPPDHINCHKPNTIRRYSSSLWFVVRLINETKAIISISTYCSIR